MSSFSAAELHTAHAAFPAPRIDQHSANWGMGIFVGLLAGAGILGSAAGLLCAASSGSGLHLAATVLSGVVLGGTLGGGLVAWRWTASVRGEAAPAVLWGLVAPRRSLWHLLWEVPAALAVQALAALPVLRYSLGEDPLRLLAAEPAPWVLPPWPVLAVIGVCGVVAIPLLEELVFRRILVDLLIRRHRPLLAVLASAVVFGAVHFLPLAAVPLLFVAGILFAASYAWHRSLWAPWILHAATHAVLFLGTVLVLN